VSGIPPTSVRWVCPLYSAIGDGLSPKQDDLGCQNPKVVTANRTRAERKCLIE
jgi:hypothetical protein